MNEEEEICNTALFDYSSFTTYIFEGEEIDAEPVKNLPAGKHFILPWIVNQSVILPGEIVPFHMETGPRAASILKAVYDNTYFVTGYGNAANQPPHDLGYGVLVELIRFELRGGFVSAYGRAKQKVEILKYYSPSLASKYSSCFGRVAPDLLPPQLRNLTPTCFERLSKNEKLRTVANLYNVQPYLLKTQSDEETAAKLIKYMLNWYTESEVSNTLNLGLSRFTYWVAYHTILTANNKKSLLMENEVLKRVTFLEELILDKIRVMCIACNNVLAKITDLDRICEYGAKALFVNEFGYGHNLIMFKNIEGYDKIDEPAKEFTWFPGFTWQILECSGCGHHIGWEFVAFDGSKKFYGITEYFVTLENNDSFANNHHVLS